MPPRENYVPEDPTSGGECDPGFTKKQLQEIRKEIDDSFVRVNTERLGGKEVPLPLYVNLPKDDDENPILTPEQYFEYVKSLVTSPNDVYKLVNPPYVEWQDDSGISDMLFPAYVTLARGGGDCDNISWVAKEFLDSLSCKGGHDYKARVIACPDETHACTVYIGEDGKLASIDQGYHRTDIADVYAASAFFEGRRGTDSKFVETEPLGLQAKATYSINPSTLARDNKSMQVQFYASYNQSFDPAAELPPAWRNYEKTTVFFSDDSKMLCEKGKVVELSSKGVEYFYGADGKVEQKHDSAKAEFYNELGQVVEVHYFDKANPVKVEFFYPGTNIVKQRDFREGQDRSYELYDLSGKLIQINYADGRVEVLHP